MICGSKGKSRDVAGTPEICTSLIWRPSWTWDGAYTLGCGMRSYCKPRQVIHDSKGIHSDDPKQKKAAVLLSVLLSRAVIVVSKRTYYP